MKIRTIALTAGALATTLLLAGCAQGSMEGMPGMGGSDTDPAATELAADLNAADQMFVTMMIPHRQQAIDIADILLAKDGIDDRVVALAERIKAALAPDIDTMNSWLDAWGIDPGDSSMSGMMGSGTTSSEDMAALESAEGGDAALLFLQLMSRHLQGCVDMASSEVDNGSNTDAVALAGKIVEDQTADVAEIEQLLTQL